jgi:hypothetical protein
VGLFGVTDLMDPTHTSFKFVVLGLKLGPYTLSHYTSYFFMMGFFEIESSKLFARAGFKPQSS